MYKSIFKSLSLVALLAIGGWLVSCHQEDGVMTVDNFVMQSTQSLDGECGAGFAGCFELVFPVSIQFADSSIVSVGSYDELKQAIRDWVVANGGRPGPNQRPKLVLPIQVITETGEIVTVETPEQLRELRNSCDPVLGGPGGPGHHGGHGGGGDTILPGGGGDSLGHGGGHHGGGHGGPGNGGPGTPCFTLNFPITLAFPDSSQVTVNTPEELQNAVRTYNQNNPGQHARPEFVFPISVTLSDGTVVTVNNEEELRAIKDACRG